MNQPTTVPRPTKKKGIPVIAWIGIGCGAIIVIGVAAFLVIGMFVAHKAKDFAKEMEANPAKVAAEMIVKLNPELEIVKSDESAGTITIREKKTGKVATFNYEAIKEGKLVFETEEGKVEINAQRNEGEGGVTVTSDEGEVRLGASLSAADLPAWVPLYPGAEDVKGSFLARTAEGETGVVTAIVRDGIDQVVEHYRSWMKANGYEITTGVVSESGGKTGVVMGRNKNENRSLNVTCVREDDGGVRLSIQYSSGGN
jgi:uncharacterized protein YneF (UPF0154 family)